MAWLDEGTWNDWATDFIHEGKAVYPPDLSEKKENTNNVEENIIQKK